MHGSASRAARGAISRPSPVEQQRLVSRGSQLYTAVIGAVSFWSVDKSVGFASAIDTREHHEFGIGSYEEFAKNLRYKKPMPKQQAAAAELLKTAMAIGKP